jgi:hypothetical protein
MILMFYIIGIGRNVDIYPSKLLWKLSVTKIGLSFSKPILEFHMFISIFYTNKVFYKIFFFFFNGVIYEVQYKSATVIE